MGEETVRVVLRFRSKTAKARVLETRWHPSQRTYPDLADPDTLLLEFHVADTLDLLPWIRSWGADAEVLEPEGLRTEIIQQVRDLANQYQITQSKMNSYSCLWAKADKGDSSRVHRLAYHLIDVGQVALIMWDRAMDAESKRRFSTWLNCDEEAVGRTLSFLISLHDLGKASPTFQIKYFPVRDELLREGFWLPEFKPIQSSPHSIVSTWALKSLLQEILHISKENARYIAHALGGHHGTWPTPMQMIPSALTPTDKGDSDPNWDTARRELVQAIMDVFDPVTGFSLPQDQHELNAFLTLFSGFTSVADWIGSMSEFFHYEKRTNVPLNEYAARSAKTAETALSRLGWLGWQADGRVLTFHEMFPLINSLNPMQKKIVDEIGRTTQPALLMIESPTGSGKTEAALYAADTWLHSQRGRGIYIAMPTQATSNQMYKRTKDFLVKRYVDETTLNFHLVHSGALLDDRDMMQTEDIYDDDQNSLEGRVRAEAWFLPRKRTLLAPFGVGTVDQALISVLQTRHFFVRMFGLQNKAIVFDEVHAYDTYMSELFKRLLMWLRHIGVSVILLSATLPERTRRELAAAYLGEKNVEVPSAEYPRLTIASREGVQSIQLETPSSRTIQLEWIDTDAKKIIEKLRSAVRDGGCAAVICNRVQRAQDVYKEIKAAGLVPEEDLILFHARFPFQWRKEIEDKVLDKFGKGRNSDKNPNRPKKAIVVATQVIEQSLDLDFDYLISDLAPIDLLIQRAGRLHRHPQNDPTRPANLKKPILVICSPQASDIPDFGHDEYIYERSIMLKTWFALKGLAAMSLPAQTTTLIEAVYGEELETGDETLRREIERAVEREERNQRKAIFEAAQQLITTPDDEDLLNQRNNNLDEDDPTVNAAFRAMTRLAEPSVTLIGLHRVNGKIYLDPINLLTPVNNFAKPDKPLAKELLKQSVALQHHAVVKYFSEKNGTELAWKGWKEVAALKHTIPIVFDNGMCKLVGTNYTLVLDRYTGLGVEKEDQ
jgi:CRISPR-associated endonuclease/helicase Cas3